MFNLITKSYFCNKREINLSLYKEPSPGVKLNNKLDWSNITEALYMNGQSRMFYQSVVTSVIFFAMG